VLRSRGLVSRRLGSSTRAIRLQLGQVFLGPAAKCPQRFDQGPAQSGKRIFYLWRNDRINLTVDQAVPLQAAESLGQHFLRNSTDLALELGLTHRLFRQQLDDQRRPFVRDPVENETGWALGVHH